MSDIADIELKTLNPEDIPSQTGLINDNFNALKKGITDIKYDIKYLDLYNVQGAIYSNNAAESYETLPLNGALIWRLATGSNYTFLGETYNNGDFILKLGNDVPLKIEQHKSGFFFPYSLKTVNDTYKLSYKYYDMVGDLKSSTEKSFQTITWYGTDTSTFDVSTTSAISINADGKTINFVKADNLPDGCKVTATDLLDVLDIGYNKGANAKDWHYVLLSQQSKVDTSSSFDTLIASSENCPIVSFMLSDSANADINYCLSVSVGTDNWILTCPDGLPICSIRIR